MRFTLSLGGEEKAFYEISHDKRKFFKRVLDRAKYLYRKIIRIVREHASIFG